jgi:hypothetical protein
MKSKDQMISFKADEALVEAMGGIPNRSEFIRAAILAALDGSCPLCQGTGVLSAQQRRHWLELQPNHAIETCADCHESRLVCRASEAL